MTASDVLQVATVLDLIAKRFGFSVDPTASPLQGIDYLLIATGIANGWTSSAIVQRLAAMNQWEPAPP